MKTSSRPRDPGGSFSSRRGHGGQLSISDTSHHVTEAIGDMYGDDDDYSKRDSRPLSFVASPLSDSIESSSDSYFDNSARLRSRTTPPRPPPGVNGKTVSKSHTLPGAMPSPRHDHGALSPTIHSGSADMANQQFPLNDIDYESNPADIAQELSNLQALRRMSMDVGNTSDPDLPSFQGASIMPSIAPTGGDDEDDPSRLFWVPARVHPELAPMEFKTFLETRVNSIKRRSGDQSLLGAEGLDRSNSGGGLRRKKSMLSRQINNYGGQGAIGYQDGAEQLERKKSLSQQGQPELKIADLKELDELVRDPTKAVQKLALDTTHRKDTNVEVPESEDMPILPAAPGVGLRRSTRTTYRKGSLRKGERVPLSKRAGARSSETDTEESPTSPAVGPGGLTRVMSEPISENFSRPSRSVRRLQQVQQMSPISSTNEGHLEDQSAPQLSPSGRSFESLDSQQHDEPPLTRKLSYQRSEVPVPRIVETPPPPEEQQVEEPSRTNFQYPERGSSQSQPDTSYQQYRDEPPQQFRDEPPPRSSRRPTLPRQASSTGQDLPRASAAPATQTLTDIERQPSLLPGNSVRTDSLTFIPTFEDKRPERAGKTDKQDSEAGSLKKGWNFFRGDDKKKGKTKSGTDTTRLDVLQNSIDTAVVRGRESLLLDRESIENKLQDERRKESSRKSGGEVKKEKDGIFSSLFGGKKKSDRELGKKAASLRSLSPEPPRRLRPDVDYSWTRFTLLEERAIYRMAHIKLANPRRALYSQVLLSNFMYSYLAKVQQMHPHVQIPQSPQQKREQEERKRREQEQMEQHQDQYRYDYHQGIADYVDQSQQQQPAAEGVPYVDDSQIYNYDHQEEDPSMMHGSNRPDSRAAQHGLDQNGYGAQNMYGRQGQEYYSYGSQEGITHRESDDSMW